LTVRPDPLFNVPLLRRRIADATRFFAPRPYLAMPHLFAGMCTECSRNVVLSPQFSVLSGIELA